MNKMAFSTSFCHYSSRNLSFDSDSSSFFPFCKKKQASSSHCINKEEEQKEDEICCKHNNSKTNSNNVYKMAFSPLRHSVFLLFILVLFINLFCASYSQKDLCIFVNAETSERTSSSSTYSPSTSASSSSSSSPSDSPVQNDKREDGESGKTAEIKEIKKNTPEEEQTKEVKKEENDKTEGMKRSDSQNEEKEKEKEKEKKNEEKKDAEDVKYEEENGVIILTEQNFDAAVTKFSLLLVEFSASWCGHCKQLDPEFSKAAQVLKKNSPPVYLAKVDYTENFNLAERFKVRGLPTIKFFMGGKELEYNGGRSSERIVQWTSKRSSPVSKKLDTVQEVEEFLANYPLAAVGFFNEDFDRKDFEWASKFVEDVLFGYTHNPEVFKKFNVSAGNILMFKPFDEKVALFSGDPNSEFAIYSFAMEHRLPLVNVFSQNTAGELMRAGRPILMVLRHHDQAGIQAESALREAAPSLKGKVLMAVAGSDESVDSRLMEHLGVKDEDLPTARLLLPPSDPPKKFVSPYPITSASLIQFVGEVMEGKLSPYLKTEPVPKEQPGPVYVVVGSTFKDVVINSKKDVLIEFYSEWCVHCQVMEPVYQQLAEKMAEQESLLVAKIDAIANDVEDVNITGFPTILLYPSNNKSHPIDYDGERKVDSLVDFLHKYATLTFSKDEL